MTITITKGKLIRWIVVAVILLCGTSQAADAPRVIASVVINREFMAGFSGYEDYHLHDVYEWRNGLFCVVLLCPAGIRETFVYDTRNGKREVIYRDAIIPRKDRREEMRRESILVLDAVRLAKTAIAGNG
ncbi:MAG: hypothetical protein LBT31_02090 [Synergistaceae bacterium]|jgi:hypothetical protein|nr:hypothetical protein [Synergistaceae bacterium]